MDYEAYRKTNFRHPAPAPRYRFSGAFAVTLYFDGYQAAVDYYEQVLGPPAYVEGEWTHGWQIGDGWLTLLKGRSGSPSNVEIGLAVETPDEAEALQAAFIAAGGRGLEPSDQLMYTLVRSCPVVDPFGTEILIFSPLPAEEG